MSTGPIHRPRWSLCALLVLGAALFGGGVAAERNAENDHHTGESSAPDVSAATTDRDEPAGYDEATETAQAHAAESTSSESNVLGINLESTALVAAVHFAGVAVAALGLCQGGPDPTEVGCGNRLLQCVNPSWVMTYAL